MPLRLPESCLIVLRVILGVELFTSAIDLSIDRLDSTLLPLHLWDVREHTWWGQTVIKHDDRVVEVAVKDHLEVPMLIQFLIAHLIELSLGLGGLLPHEIEVIRVTH